MMKKITLLVSMLLIFLGTTFPRKIGTLTEIYKPQMIKVYDDELFAVEGHRVFIYALKDLSLKKIIGKKGEGPGEFNPDPARTIIITVLPDTLLGESRNKVLWFSRDGSYRKEIKKTPGILQTLPIGDNFFIHKILYGPGGKNYFTVNIYNSDFQETRELFRQKFFNYEQNVFIMPDSLNYCLCDNKIFVEKSTEGFIIDVYDYSGNRLYRIEKPYNKIPVPDSRKKEAYNDYLEIPFFKRMIREQGKAYFNNYIKSETQVYPDYYPAIQDIIADPKSKKIYVKTYLREGDREEYLEMDIQGNILKKHFFPRARKVDFLVQMQGDKKYYTIHGGQFYYLKSVETEDDEDWELHAEEIK